MERLGPPADQTPLQPPLVLDYGRPDLVAGRPILPLASRIIHFFSAIVLPPICFILASTSDPLAPDYQRGRWDDYIGLIPTTRVGWTFYPFLVFSMYTAAMMIFRPARAIDRLHIRIGLFTGAVLALQYCFIQTAAVADITDGVTGSLVAVSAPIVFAAVLLFIDWLARWLIWKARWYQGRGRLLFWIAIAVVATGMMIASKAARGALIEITVIGPLFLAPFLTFTTFVSLSILVIRRGDRSVAPLPMLIAWLSGWALAFAAAWTKSYFEAVKAYAALPPHASGCYIATAAAQGHPRIVRSQLVNNIRLNTQLAILKAGEITIALRWPRVHHMMRVIYDQVGPGLARKLQNPYAADATYLTLKPIEWITAAMLSMGHRSHDDCIPCD